MGTLMKNGISYSGGGSELPEYTSADAEKVLKVNSGGSGLEWAEGGGGTTGEYLEKDNPTGKGALKLSSIRTTVDVNKQQANIVLGDNQVLYNSSGIVKQDDFIDHYGNIFLGNTSTSTKITSYDSALYESIINGWNDKHIGYTYNSILVNGINSPSSVRIAGRCSYIGGNSQLSGPSSNARPIVFEYAGALIGGWNNIIKTNTTSDTPYSEENIYNEGSIIAGSSSTVNINSGGYGGGYGCYFNGYHNNIALSSPYGVSIGGQGITAQTGYTWQGWDINGYYNTITGVSGYGNSVEGEYVNISGSGSLIGAHVQGYYHYDINSSGSMYGADHGGYYTTAIVGRSAYGDLLRGYNVFCNGNDNYGTLVSGYNISLSYGFLSGGAIEGYGFGAPGQPVLLGGDHYGVHIEGVKNFFTRESTASATTAVHIEGYQNKFYSSTSSAYGTHIEGYNSTAVGHSYGLHVEGNSNYISEGISSHIEGEGNSSTSAWYSHLEGLRTSAICTSAGQSLVAVHVEGEACVVVGEGGNVAAGAHAEGWSSTASGRAAHSEGMNTLASGTDSHAEGNGTVATGSFTHAEGETCSAVAEAAHAEGYGTLASGEASHAEGRGSIASNDYSHASGRFNITNRVAQTVVGEFNNPTTGALFIVGNGGSQDSRSNAFEVNDDGNATLSGDLTVNYGGTSYNVGQTLANISISTITTADAGKVLMVDANGHLVLATVPAWS